MEMTGPRVSVFAFSAFRGFIYSRLRPDFPAKNGAWKKAR